MAGELVVGVVADYGAVADRAVEPFLSDGDSAIQPRRYVDQVVVERDKLTFEVCRVSGDVALALADHEPLIAAQAAQHAQRNDHGDQGDRCNYGRNYGD